MGECRPHQDVAQQHKGQACEDLFDLAVSPAQHEGQPEEDQRHEEFPAQMGEHPQHRRNSRHVGCDRGDVGHRQQEHDQDTDWPPVAILDDRGQTAIGR
jgi:hypothetical protein